MSNRAPLATDAPDRDEPIAATDASLTSKAAYAISATVAEGSRQVVPAAVIAIPPSRAVDRTRPSTAATIIDDAPDYGSHRRRAEAWERERERCSSLTTHRKTL